MKVLFATSSYNQVCFMDNVHKIKAMNFIYSFVHSIFYD